MTHFVVFAEACNQRLQASFSFATRPRLATLLAVFFLALPAAGEQAKPLEPPEMLAIVADALKAWDVPGAAVVVVDRDHVLWLRGQGVRDIETHQPLTHETLV